MCALTASPLTPPSHEDAEKWMREVGMFHKLEVAEIAPDGERRPRWLSSLMDVVEFLLPTDEGEKGAARPAVNYVDPDALATWIRESIGDPELADRMQEVIASGTGYVLLSGELGRLALTRALQCWELLKPDHTEQPSS
jgi:hypothetical protein